MRNRLLFIAVLLLGGFITGNALAATDSIKEGGIGGTGAPAMRGGIGGTGTPAMDGGIGGTGLRPDNESIMPTLAGKVLFITGQVEAQNHGQVRPLSKGDPVRVGDMLKSGKGASLQLRMEDGGTIVLRPESQLSIESFVYKGIQDGSEHIALALLSGGFRAVTGNIGNLHKENYSIRTPNAIVGILGTDHETVFVSKAQPGQTAAVEPGTYNHVISGATLLQSEQGKLQIKPNQTGFAALSGASPIMLDRPLPIFGDPKANSNEHGEHHDNKNNSDERGEHNGITGNSGKERLEHTGLGDSITDTEHNKFTQTERLNRSSVDISTLEKDASPATPGSAVVGVNMASGLLVVGGAQAGNPGEKLFLENNVLSSYFNATTNFNFLDNGASFISYESAQVDSVKVTWGIYAGGVVFDTAGKAIMVNFHPFAFANGGGTPLAVVGSMSGSANFSNVVGYTKPVTESGALGGSVNLNVGINLGTNTVTSYNLSVTDVNSRNWIGTLGSPVAFSTFAQNGTPLAVTCGGTSCGSGMGHGVAAGMLIGPNAKGMISSYALSTTTGQAVAGAVVISRP